jgi:hypothetical protein
MDSLIGGLVAVAAKGATGGRKDGGPDGMAGPLWVLGCGRIGQR